MSSAAVGTHSGAGPLSLMSCVRESSPLQDFDSDTEKNVASKRRFWNPRKWFKRRNKAAEDVIVVETSSTEIGKDALRSRSTSELSVAEETKRRSSGPMHPGLSVSHDSVFHSPNSGSDMELDAAQSSSSLSISQHHIDLRLQSELNERLRLRRGRGDTSEDDEGFPHSSCNSPTASDGLLLDKTGIKDLPVKSHSTCSDGSLLSMGSSEMDEDSIAPQSRHSSKLSLYDKKSTTDSQFEFEPSASTTPLNHSAAHHRVAVKPKRTHGAPRRKRGQQLTSALPVTPEVNEEAMMIRSTSPEINMKETLTELYSMSATSRTTTLTETQLKCSSLPPGLPAPGSETAKLNRSKSNAGSKSQEEFDDDKEEKPSLFDRIFPRRSGRKKRHGAREEPEAGAPKARSAPRPVPAPRSGPASRQRVQPCDIPATPDEVRREQPGAERDSTAGTSPLQAELENRFKQRQFTLSTSPPKPKSPLTPPLSPKSPKAVESSTSVILSKSEYVHHHHHQHHHTRTSNSTHSQTKPKIAGLSSLQQRVLALNSDEPDDSFQSLTEAQSLDPRPSVTKSLSFKSPRRDAKSTTEEFLDREREQSRVPFAKATSLDSVKNLEDPPRQPEVAKSADSLLKLKTEENVELFRDSAITITGPSHTAVVNVTTTSSKEDFASRNQTVEELEGSHRLSVKEHQVSVTKIQVKRESTEVSQSTVTVPKLSVPEFFNKQLNKVETKPTTNIIFSMKSPKPVEESEHRPKTLFDFEVTSKPPAPRRFSKENLEIIEKDQETSPKTPTFNRFKKNEPKGSRKSSVVSITPDSPVREIKNVFKSRSTSLDSLSSDKSSQDSLDKLEEDKSKESPTVVLRKKSLATKKNEEEPELMKVFARRSLKLKDNEIDAIQDNLLDVKTRDSDKENQIDSPIEDRPKWPNEPVNNDKHKEDIIKEPLVENKTTVKDNTSPPTLRRTFNSNIFAGQRTVSLNQPKATPEFILKKQPSFQEHRKGDGWISKNEEMIVEDRKSEFITEPKNFSQRKAEWEKRAQQAQRKTTP